MRLSQLYGFSSRLVNDEGNPIVPQLIPVIIRGAAY